MAKEMIVSGSPLETKVAVLEDDLLVEFYIERSKTRGILGNIYKGRVTKVLPGMQSAFVDIGLEKDAFLYVSDFFEETEEYEKIFTIEEKAVNAIEQLAQEKGKGRQEWRREERARMAARQEQRKPIEVIQTPEQTIEAVEAWQLEESATPSLEETIIDALPSDCEAILRGGDGISYFSAPAPRRGRRSQRSRRQRSRPRPSKAERWRQVERQSIEDLLREGQEIMVQVAKEPIGKKGARVTSHIALPGRFLVYMPTVDHVGVSRKIASEAERSRLKEIVLRNKDSYPGGFIVRTAAQGQSEAAFQADMRYLVTLWEEIRSRFERASAPALLHSELDLVQRIMRDQLSPEFNAIRVDDEGEYARILDFINRFQPGLLSKVRLYTKQNPILNEYGINSEIEKALQPKVWLKSGGYIVINQTEALVAIDVNTGKFVGRGDSLEETITRTNLEAVKEIVRQIRLRDLGGIIVIDFIDMEERKNRKKVMEALENEVAKDKSPTKILEFNEFGLVAITRKRVKQSLERQLCQVCPDCNGAGYVKSTTTTCYAIYDEIRKMSKQIDGEEILLRVHPDVARALRESESIVITEIKNLTGKEVVIRPDPLLHIEQFNIVT